MYEDTPAHNIRLRIIIRIIKLFTHLLFFTPNGEGQYKHYIRVGHIKLEMYDR